MVYGDTGQSITDCFFSTKGKELHLENYSEVFDFHLKERELFVSTDIENQVENLDEFFIEEKTIFVNAYRIEGTSLYYGDLLCNLFDDDNNMINPPSDTGWFLYNLFGYTFDSSQASLESILIRVDPITCPVPYLDIIAQEFNLKRCPDWTDEYWRALILYYYYNMQTLRGIEFVINLLYNYNSQTILEEPIDVTVDGYSQTFFMSDKYDVHSLCSDKFGNEEDYLSSSKDSQFQIQPPEVLEDLVIIELLKILENGAVRCR